MRKVRLAGITMLLVAALAAFGQPSSPTPRATGLEEECDEAPNFFAPIVANDWDGFAVLLGYNDWDDYAEDQQIPLISDLLEEIEEGLP